MNYFGAFIDDALINFILQVFPLLLFCAAVAITGITLLYIIVGGILLAVAWVRTFIKNKRPLFKPTTTKVRSKAKTAYQTIKSPS